MGGMECDREPRVLYTGENLEKAKKIAKEESLKFFDMYSYVSLKRFCFRKGNKFTEDKLEVYREYWKYGESSLHVDNTVLIFGKNELEIILELLEQRTF